MCMVTNLLYTEADSSLSCNLLVISAEVSFSQSVFCSIRLCPMKREGHTVIQQHNTSAISISRDNHTRIGSLPNMPLNTAVTHATFSSAFSSCSSCFSSSSGRSEDREEGLVTKNAHQSNEQHAGMTNLFQQYPCSVFSCVSAWDQRGQTCHAYTMSCMLSSKSMTSLLPSSMQVASRQDQDL